jgi:UDPglucose 6-dehydrogenase
MASLGHEVVGVDTDSAKVERLARGEPPFFEPGLEALLKRSEQNGSLEFTTDIAAIADAEVHFICVGTPQLPDALGADLTALVGAVEAMVPVIAPGSVVVGKSTVPVGTARRVAERVAAAGATLVWNPEFLREGHAVHDTLQPDRIVYGVDTLAEAKAQGGAVGIVDGVYRTMLEGGAPRLVMSYESAELVKTAANSYLALRVSFINAISDLADASGADVLEVAAALRLDDRIGRLFLNPGLGFGGGCLPKDLHALAARAGELGVMDTAALLAAANQVNETRRPRVKALAARALGGVLAGRRIAVLGLSFKPLSDDVRNSQSALLADDLVAAGAVVTATDPAAVGLARVSHPGLRYADTVGEAVADAELIILATEWQEYRDLDPGELAGWTRARTLIDARCVIDSARWSTAGWTVLAPGRPASVPGGSAP